MWNVVVVVGREKGKLLSCGMWWWWDVRKGNCCRVECGGGGT